jgi:AcrR family transcriptional regulator
VTSISERRPKTRDRILAAAREVFAEVGFSGFTMTEVERRVGLAVGTGSIYRHFRSRGALLQAVMETELRLHRQATADARAALRQGADPVERRVSIFRQLLRDLHRFNPYFALVLEEGTVPPELRAAVRSALQPDPEDSGDGVDVERLDPYAMAALGGYHLFSIMQGRPFEGIKEDQFLRTLAEMTERRLQAADTASKKKRERRAAS